MIGTGNLTVICMYNIHQFFLPRILFGSEHLKHFEDVYANFRLFTTMNDNVSEKELVENQALFLHYRIKTM